MNKKCTYTVNPLTFFTLVVALFWSIYGNAQSLMTHKEEIDVTSDYTIPTGVTSIKVSAWGGGGGGSSSSSSGNKAGGGGGAYSSRMLNVTPGQTYRIVVGNGGSSNSAGQNSEVLLGSNTLVRAAGGQGGNGTTAGAGGQASEGISGSNGTTSGHGGKAGGADGGAGGAGRGLSIGNGNSGEAPGGGGGGGRGRGYNGGQGGRGKVIIEFTYTEYITPANLGSGSRDLYPSNATGNRAMLVDGKYSAPEAIPFPNSGAHYVFANAGETITIGSSAQGIGAGRIKMFSPSGTEVVDDATNGKIANRAQEIAGPQIIGLPAYSNRYRPIYYKVPATGIYRVEFTAPVNNNNVSSAPPHTLANANWVQDSYYGIWAWDVAVINAAQTAFIPGRTYTTNMNLSNGNSKTNSSPVNYESVQFNGRMYVRTRDGYTYRVKHNGSSGIVFAFFVNNLGFKNSTGKALYKSLNVEPSSAASQIHNPNLPDNLNNVTHKMFYTLPAVDLPLTATASIGVKGVAGSTPVNNSTTWLKATVVEPDVTNVALVGVEGTIGFFGHKGGHINFTAPVAGQEYEILIILPTKNNAVFTTLNGVTALGANSVYWDGKGLLPDGSTSLEGMGNIPVNAKVQLKGAEVHFPFFDIEYNKGGISVELFKYNALNYSNPDLTPIASNIVYWNDSDIPLGTNPSGTNEASRRRSDPLNNSHFQGNGVNSVNNGHKYGEGGSGAEGTFGDKKSLDTWTFIVGASQTVESEIDVKKADLYTALSYKIDGVSNAKSAIKGQGVVYTVKAGNYGPSDVIADASKGLKGAKFTFQVPGGVKIVGTPSMSVSCANGTASEAVALSYDASTRMYRSELSLSDGCFVTYTFTGVLEGIGGQIAEATIMRPADVTDPDATNPATQGGAPTNPHFECYNNDAPGTGSGSSGLISCNNITEQLFMVLEECVDQVLYYEDFDRGYFAQNSGRTSWVNKPSIKITEAGAIAMDANGMILRTGTPGGATSSYLFAPGINDPAYAAANVAPHSQTISVARIKNGYYGVLPPGYVQMGIPTTDSWNQGLWVPNAPSNDPTLANSNYDWTPAWDKPNAIRDMSGAVNGSAFLVRGNNASNNSVKPFYEFDINTTVEKNKVYSLDLYSYVTYHNKDYMLMDVIDKNTGHIYATVPLKYPGPGLPEGASPEGFSLGWVPLKASFSFNEDECEILNSNLDIKIAIRGSHDPMLNVGKGFGHTLLDNILFTSEKVGHSCSTTVSGISCADDCYRDINGKGFKWHHQEGTVTNGSILTEQFTQPGSDGGFILDIYKLDNSFNMNINGTDIFDEVIEFQSGVPGNSGGITLVQNIRFKSDKAMWSENKIPGGIWTINANASIDLTDRTNNPTPAIRVMVDRWGNAKMYGKRTTESALEELELFDKNNPAIVKGLSQVLWKNDQSEENVVLVNQLVVGTTAMAGFGYGQEYKDCETCELDKEGVFVDRNNNGFSEVGEKITYTFDVRNLGDMEIYDIEITDPLLGSNIKVIQDSNGNWVTNRPDVTFTGDTTNFGVLDRNETWTFIVDYTTTNTDVFTNRGVYNRATVTGVGRILSKDNEHSVNVDSKDPTPYQQGDIGWDPNRPFHTYVPLKRSSLMITNPNIYQKVK